MSATGSPNSPADRPRLPSAPPTAARKVLEGEATLDARRAVYLPKSGILAVADLHLGYAWVQRRRGALMPLSAPDSTGARLAPLLAEYRPRQLVVLGDLVHQAVALPALEAELRLLVRGLPEETELVVCLGNHDRELGRLLDGLKLSVRVQSELRVGRHRLHHGDDAPPGRGAGFQLEADRMVDVIGHEHPVLRLGDGVATEAKVPCFLVAENVLVVPAFSDWAAGCDVGRGAFLGRVARRARFHTAFACLGSRLLRVPLKPRG